jgi:hypothetical protein
LGTLNIGDDIILSRIINSAMSIQGVKDVRDASINGVKGNVAVRPDEKGEFRKLEIFVGD